MAASLLGLGLGIAWATYRSTSNIHMDCIVLGSNVYYDVPNSASGLLSTASLMSWPWRLSSYHYDGGAAADNRLDAAVVQAQQSICIT